MSTAVMERTESPVKTRNVVLNMKLHSLTDKELDEISRYADYLMWLREDDDDDWADAPLTPDEEAQIEESEKDFKNGTCLTLEELLEGI